MTEKKRTLTIAIVDDYDIFRKQFQRQLSACGGYDLRVVGEADNGASALEMLRQNRDQIDIVFTDIRMPKMDGIALLEQAKKEDLCRYVVLLSEYTDFEYARKGIVLGAFDYLVKPVRPEDLEELLDRVCASMDSGPSPDEDTYKEKEIEACILGRDSYMDELAADFLEHYRKKEGADAGRCALHVAEALGRITAKIQSEYTWTENIFPQFPYRDKILDAETMREVERQAGAYLHFIWNTVRRYYPAGISGASGKAAQYVLAHPASRVTLSDIAEICNVNYAYLSHCFKNELKISFIDYCTRYKMDLVKTMLRTTDLSIMSIAEKLHYDDYKYMSRIFKNTEGLTPSEYRRKDEP